MCEVKCVKRVPIKLIGPLESAASPFYLRSPVVEAPGNRECTNSFGKRMHFEFNYIKFN